MGLVAADEAMDQCGGMQREEEGGMSREARPECGRCSDWQE